MQTDQNPGGKDKTDRHSWASGHWNKIWPLIPESSCLKRIFSDLQKGLMEWVDNACRGITGRTIWMNQLPLRYIQTTATNLMTGSVCGYQQLYLSDHAGRTSN